MANSDIEWEKWGKNNPYYGVSSHKPYLRDNLSEKNTAHFFSNGEAVAETVFSNIRKYFREPWVPLMGADFGCGVGRLTIPLARRCDKIVGIDVSDSMLAEARKNCDKAGLNNVTFIKSDDQLSQLNSALDMFVTFYVLQHIPVKRGLAFVRQLVKRLAPGGIGVLQFPYNDAASRLIKTVNWAQVNLPCIHGVVNLVKSRPWGWPQMQANVYPLNTILTLLDKEKCKRVYLEIVGHERFPSVVLYCQKIVS